MPGPKFLKKGSWKDMLEGRTMVLLGGWLLRFAGLSLVLASFRLCQRALDLGLDPLHLLWLGPAGVALGVFKARRVMRPRLLENVAWLRGQRAVPAWRLFAPSLLLLIACMVALMTCLKLLARGHAPSLAALGTMDLAVATSLLLSARVHGSLLGRNSLDLEKT